jgi:hypothetical protein
VCPDCEALDETQYTIEEAHGLIPYHPNCRCAFIPAQPEDDDEDKDAIAAKKAEVNEELGVGV